MNDIIIINPSAVRITPAMYPTPEAVVDAVSAVCYARAPKTVPSDQIKFAKGLLGRNPPHLTPFEFVPVYFKEDASEFILPVMDTAQGKPLSYVEYEKEGRRAFGVTSLRTVLDLISAPHEAYEGSLTCLLEKAVYENPDFANLLPPSLMTRKVGGSLTVSFTPFEENVKTRVETVLFTTTRRVSHQLVRHRRMKILQESQRYVGYTNLEVILPARLKQANPAAIVTAWKSSIKASFATYNDLISYGLAPQDARDVLPNATATRVIMSGTLREWAWVLHLRCGKGADPEMRRLMIPLKERMVNAHPILSDLIKEAEKRYDSIIDTGTAA